VDVKRLFFMVILAVLVTGLVLFGLSDNAISAANTGTQYHEVIGAVSEASNSSASASITITMTGVLN
jgi:hypothetical protein